MKELILNIAGVINGITNDREAGHILIGIIASITGHIDETKWQVIIRELLTTPCNEDGCDCHISMAAVCAGLEELREDWKMYSVKPQPELTKPIRYKDNNR